MEIFCKDLGEHAVKIMKKKEVISIINEENELYEMQKVCYICRKIFSTDKNDKNVFKLYHKVRDHCHYTGKFRGAAHSICNLRYKTPKEIPVVFHNGSTYDYHFIINQLTKEFNGQLECLGENAEKYITFSVPIKEELDNNKTIMYKLKFVIVLNLCQPQYQVLLITYLKFTIKNGKNVKKREKSNQYAILLVLKIIN